MTPRNSAEAGTSAEYQGAASVSGVAKVSGFPSSSERRESQTQSQPESFQELLMFGIPVGFAAEKRLER
jgi:hypothetical protein